MPFFNDLKYDELTENKAKHFELRVSRNQYVDWDDERISGLKLDQSMQVESNYFSDQALVSVHFEQSLFEKVFSIKSNQILLNDAGALAQVGGFAFVSLFLVSLMAVPCARWFNYVYMLNKLYRINYVQDQQKNRVYPEAELVPIDR